MNFARLPLRVIVGSLFFGHGTQKLFGWFDGHGLDATAAVEAGGGAAFAFGFKTARRRRRAHLRDAHGDYRVHLKNGPWTADGGYEYNLVMIAAVLALTEVGPGGRSLNHALGWERSGPGWALGALGAGVVGAVARDHEGRSLGWRVDAG